VRIFNKSAFRTIIQHLLIFFAVSHLLLIGETSLAATATDYGAGRTRSCDNKGDYGDLDFDFTTGGKDVEFVLTNPVCITVIATTYAAVKIAIALMNRTCGSGSSIPRVTPSPLMDSFDIAKGTVKAASSQSGACAGAVTGASTAFGVAIGELAIIYAAAHTAYKNAKVCGSDWKAVNPSEYDFSGSGVEEKRRIEIMKRFAATTDPETDPLTSFGNDVYDEWFFGGVKVQDNTGDGSEKCLDVTAGSIGNHPPQTYYLKGTAAGNFDCEKYKPVTGLKDPLSSDGSLSESRKADFEKAYACCKKRSQQYICLEYVDDTVASVEEGSGFNLYKESRVFCKAGELCVINGITFSTKFIDNNRMICAESYSVCPYNFTLSGGTEYCDFYRDGKWNSSSGRWDMITSEDIEDGNCSDKSEIRNEDCTFNSKSGKCRNYCQYLTHCTTVSSADYNYNSSLGSPYFANACLNFVGDSQNKVSYNGMIIGRQRHFSAPIAQCMRETMENLFYNRAGHSKCSSVNEYPAADGTCVNGYIRDGDFEYQQGNIVSSRSFFVQIQDNVKDIVKMILILSITFYGFNILILKNDIRNKKDILTYLLKIGLVLYFATGTAWQDVLFEGVYGTSSELGRIVFKIDVGTDEKKRDGCQFGKQTLPNGTIYDSGRNYPEGKEYLAIWDTLDCKIMRYLGFGPQASAANIASLILASMMGPAGIYFALSVLFLGLMFLAATMRALHIFLSSCIAIILMIFISPIIIPTVLFAKTADIFKNWVKELISFCMQPMILFAYIAFMVIVIDRSLIGSATFVGPGPHKGISCEKYCKNADDTIEPNSTDGSLPSCTETGQRMVNPLDDSVACLIGFDSFGKFPGLEIFGLSIPILKNLLEENVKQRILTILKGAIVMYLVYKFMDEISGITARLIGGSDLPGSPRNAFSTLQKIAGAAESIRKRIKGGAAQAAKAAYENRDSIKDKLGGSGNKGKSTAEVDDKKDDAGSSEGGDSGGGESDGGGEDK
jgi:hypothetical protein